MSRTVALSLIIGIGISIASILPWDELKYLDYRSPFNLEGQWSYERLEQIRKEYFARALDADSVIRLDRLSDHQQTHFFSICEQTIEPISGVAVPTSAIMVFQCDVGDYRAFVRLCRYVAWEPPLLNGPWFHANRMDIVIPKTEPPTQRIHGLFPDGCSKFPPEF